MNTPNLVVMLTYNDRTVENAYEVFEECKNSKAKYFGFKEIPLPIDEMKTLYSYMKSCGKTTVLEVVEYNEQAGLNGAKIAVECGVDILMGTYYFRSIHQLCIENGIQYMPFIGNIKGRPSVLEGSASQMIEQAKEYSKQGVAGFDLLGYRYTGNAKQLIQKLHENIDLPICVAGSISTYEQLDHVKKVGAWGFTIGSAFFDHCFGDTMEEQINAVVDYLEKDSLYE